ncbi:MAG: YkgJ family cysteine cluster protein [Shimia sp.]
MTTKTRAKLAKAKLKGAGVARGKALLDSYLGASGLDDAGAAKELHQGTAAMRIGQIAAQTRGAPQGLACAEGCAFCCILTGEDGGTITGAEAKALHTALSEVEGPDGRDWHPMACPALDPETRRCRAYAARPMICRSYVSPDADACEKIAAGEPVPGPGVIAAYSDYLTAHALGRAVLGPSHAPTYSLRAIATAAVEGTPLKEALSQARHRPRELEAERLRVARD